MDWSLKPGWSCEKIGSVFDSTLLFSKGDKKWTRGSLARTRDDELQQSQERRNKEAICPFGKPGNMDVFSPVSKPVFGKPVFGKP